MKGSSSTKVLVMSLASVGATILTSFLLYVFSSISANYTDAATFNDAQLRNERNDVEIKTELKNTNKKLETIEKDVKMINGRVYELQRLIIQLGGKL